jgi:lipoate-protein ligase B
VIIETLRDESVSSIHKRLLIERQRRIDDANRSSISDLALVYEPKECFSVNHDSDLNFVKNKESFWKYMRDKTIPLLSIARGGGIMWHGPGQIILAPVVDISERKIDLTQYREYLEKAVLNTLQEFSINGILTDYAQGSRGVWIEDPINGDLKKIAFLGFNCSRGIAIHGCAINVSPDLYPLSLIYPCNLTGVEAISMQAIIGNQAPNATRVGEILAKEFKNIIEAHKKVR